MKRLLIFLNIAALLSMTNAMPISADNSGTLPAHVVCGHPRILLLKGEEGKVRQKVEAGGFLQEVHEAILETSRKMLEYPTLEYVKTGKRLLSVSRSALKQIYYLSYSYRMTGDEHFARQAEKVMLDVCAFPDWNPSHFLDVAEMTAAVAIGYDWLYGFLDEETKSVVRKAIITKGLKESVPEMTDHPENLHWMNKRNNWNAVCNMGMVCGAVAVYEDCPELASSIIARSVKSAQENSLAEYRPDGNYPEGYMYWNYGTNFLVMLADIVNKATNLELLLQNDKAFMNSGYYMAHMTTQDFGCFAYSDCNVWENKLCIPLFWMAGVNDDLSLLYGEAERIRYLKEAGKGDSLFTFRLLPSILVWAPENCIGDNPAPEKRIFVGQGETPVALLRNHFGGNDEIFAGLKGGSCNAGHAHMDIGSFVMYMGNNEWFKDLGNQDYNSLEKEGINLFERSQYSPRWKPFRVGMYSHNQIIFEDSLQRVEPTAIIGKYGDREGFVYAATDLTDIQGGLVDKYVRGIAIVDDDHFIVRDEINTSGTDIKIRWAALTPSDVTLLDDRTALLTMNGDSLLVKAEGPGIKLETYSTDPPHYYDAPNPGTVMIGFSTVLSGDRKYAFTITMYPPGVRTNYWRKTGNIEEW